MVWHDWYPSTYPLQITVHHPLIVHVHKAPGDIFELLGRLLVKGVTGDRSEGLRVRTDQRPSGTRRTR